MAKKNNWVVTPRTDEAAEDVASLFNDDDVKAEVLRILSLLAQEIDPRSPKIDSGLIVDELERDSPNWFRVKVPRYAIRVVFRLIVHDGQKLIKLKANEPIPAEAIRKFIEIMQARYRKDAYGEELKRRYRKYSMDEEEE
jgi:hypothetical protein